MLGKDGYDKGVHTRYDYTMTGIALLIYFFCWYQP